MKWFNSDRETRRTTWPHVRVSEYQWSTEEIKAAHRWCQKHDSDGRFYHHYTNTRWWFEKEEDAVIFALTWSGNQQGRNEDDHRY